MQASEEQIVIGAGAEDLYSLLVQTLGRDKAYAKQLEYVYEQEEAGRAFVIQPLTALDCPTLEKSTAKLEAIYQLGYKQGLEVADKVKDFIS